MKAFRRTMGTDPHVRRIHLIRWIAAAALSTAIVLGGSGCSIADLAPWRKAQVTPPAATSVPQAALMTPTPTALPTVTPTVEPAQAGGICGRQDRVTVLLLGESLPEDQPLRGASAIRLVQVDYGTGTVRVLALPPYLTVRTPALAPAGIESSPLTLVYWKALGAAAALEAAATPGATVPPGAAATLTPETGSERDRMAHASAILAQTLEDNFGLVADAYVTLKQGTFVDAIDALGGLEIDLPEDVDGAPSGFPFFRAGEQTLGGQAALDYMSIYPAAGDAEPIEWARLARQRQVMAALRDQLVRPQTVVRLPALIEVFYQDVVTDLSPGQVPGLLCALQAPELAIEHLALEPDMVTVGPDNVLTPKVDEITAFLEMSFIQ